MGLLAMGTAAFVVAANGEDVEQVEKINEDSSNPIAQFFETLFQQKNKGIDNVNINQAVNENEQIKKENEALIEENQKLKEQLAMLRRKDDIDTTSQDNTLDNEQLVSIQFPKGKGNHTKFKNVIEQVKLHEESAIKLTEICQAILNKSELINKEDFLKLLSSKIGNTLELENFVEETYQKLNTNSPQQDDVERAKILERIENSQKIRSKQEIKRKEKTNNAIEEKVIPEFSVEDSDNNIYRFKIPGTINHDFAKNLTTLLLQFEEHYNKTMGVSKWMYRHAVSENVREIDIIKEINMRKNGTSPYKNISAAQVTDLLDLLQNDKRYSEYFTLHSALRFIDRFIDFDSNIPIKQQSNDNLNLLFTAVSKALSQGVQVESYQDCKHEAYAARIVIEPDSIKNPEAFNLSGSFPLIITICENQPVRGYYNKRNKSPLISTIFADGN